MRNIAFVIWTLGWPLVNSISIFLIHLRGIDYSDTDRGTMSLIFFVIWIFVGYKLYESKPKK